MAIRQRNPVFGIIDLAKVQRCLELSELDENQSPGAVPPCLPILRSDLIRNFLISKLLLICGSRTLRYAEMRRMNFQTRQSVSAIALGLLMVFYMTAAAGAACVCNETAETEHHAPSCGCIAPVETDHCADTCMCPVCCEIDIPVDEFYVPPAVFTTHPVPDSPDAARITVGTLFPMAETQGIRFGPDDAVPFRSGDVDLYRHVCVYRL